MYNINLIEYFQHTVWKFGDCVAIIDGDRHLSFNDLNIRAQYIGSLIYNLTGGVSNVVGVFLNKSAEAVISDIGITYSGNAYMNLDVKNPLERLNNILNLIKPGCIITDSKNKGKIIQIYDADKIIDIDEIEWPDALSKTETNYWKNLIDTDIYCVINTSGSTGTPKAVALNHRSFIDFFEQTVPMYGFNENDNIGSLSPIIFDIWSYELTLLMGVGATITVLPDSLASFPIRILQLMEKQSVTYIFWVPTIMVNIANMGLLEKTKLPSLRLVWFAGEVFPTKQFNIWKHSLPHVQFSNYYGPIEITLDCIYYDINTEIPDDKPLPIGRPFRNTGILLLDSDDKLVTNPYTEGEICVKGSSLALGYYNNEEKTAAAFVQNPLNSHYPEIIYRTGDIAYYNEDGLLIFKGRKDTLIKHLGYRIELAEIEHVIINILKIVSNGCVVYNSSKKEITLFYEAEKEITPSDFRKNIGQALPHYMIPVVFHHLKEMKRNPNGKIDRAYYNSLVK